MRKVIALLLVVLLLGALATVCFADDISSPTAPTETEKPNPEPISPPTGVNVALYAVLFVIGLFGVVLTTTKLVKNH